QRLGFPLCVGDFPLPHDAPGPPRRPEAGPRRARAARPRQRGRRDDGGRSTVDLPAGRRECPLPDSLEPSDGRRGTLTAMLPPPSLVLLGADSIGAPALMRSAPFAPPPGPRLASPAAAHPHVFVTSKSEIVYD